MTNFVEEVYGQFFWWEDEKEPGVRWLGFHRSIGPNEDNTIRVMGTAGSSPATSLKNKGITTAT